MMFTPTEDQVKAVDLFRAKYTKEYCKKHAKYKFKDWVDALHTAWYEGWDYNSIPDLGHCLRQVRNTPGGWEWVAGMKGVK